MPTEEKKENTAPAKEATAAAEQVAPKADEKPVAKKAPEKAAAADRAHGDRNDRGGRGGGGRGGRGGGRGKEGRPQEEFESKIVDLARVTRVMAGGKRMRFRCCVVVGDKKGKIGMGVKKGADVQLAISKSSDQAKKHLITVPIKNGTIPHTIEVKYKGAHVLLKTAKDGTGIIAGGPVRIALEMAGVKNVVAKIKGSTNKVNNVSAVMQALSRLSTEEHIKKLRS